MKLEDVEKPVDCLILEKVKGETLEKVIQAGGYELPFVTQVTTHLLHALHQLEYPRERVVWRDITPRNIMYISEPANTFEKTYPLRVIDGGLAVRVGADLHNEDGIVEGSPMWMAPEQWDWQNTLDERTNVYQAGCVIAHLLTGKFEDAASSESMMNAMIKSINGSIQRTIERLLEEKERETTDEADRRTIHDVFAPVILKATQTDPALRYENVTEMERDFLAKLEKAFH